MASFPYAYRYRWKEVAVCEGCGKQFSQAGRPGPDAKYCSNACRQRAYRIAKRIRGEASK